MPHMQLANNYEIDYSFFRLTAGGVGGRTGGMTISEFAGGVCKMNRKNYYNKT